MCLLMSLSSAARLLWTTMISVHALPHHNSRWRMFDGIIFLPFNWALLTNNVLTGCIKYSSVTCSFTDIRIKWLADACWWSLWPWPCQWEPLGVKLRTGVAVGWSLKKHQGLVAWYQLRPWNRLTKEPWCRNPILTEVINRICLFWGRLRGVGVPHPHRGDGPDGALRWVHGLIIFLFSNVEQGDSGVMMGVVEGPARRMHGPCVRIFTGDGSVWHGAVITSRCWLSCTGFMSLCTDSLKGVFDIVFSRSRPVMSAWFPVRLVSCGESVTAVLSHAV